MQYFFAPYILASLYRFIELCVLDNGGIEPGNAEYGPIIQLDSLVHKGNIYFTF